MTEASLFDYIPPYVRTSDTSREAAEAIKPERGRLQKRVLDFIKATGAFGATAEEISIGTELVGNTVRPRLIELEADNAIEKTDDRRKTQSGRKAVVYRVKEASA